MNDSFAVNQCSCCKLPTPILYYCCENCIPKWVSVKERLPNHQQIILVFAKTMRGVDGYGVATFVDSIKMNEELSKTPYKNECVDVKKHPYYFVSQEVRQHTFNNVSHWMPLPLAPQGENDG